MRRMFTRSLFRDERGLSTLEYAILLVLILVGSIQLWTTLGKDLQTGLKTGTTEFGKAIKSKPASGGGG